MLHLMFVAFGVNVPPTPPSDQVPPVAEPPTEPPNVAEVDPWHIALSAEPPDFRTFSIFSKKSSVMPINAGLLFSI